MVRLPSEYQEVEYIESTGTQYFWTNVNVQDNLTVDSIQTFHGGDNYLFGGSIDGSLNGKNCFNGYYNGKVQGAYPNIYYNVGSVKNDNATVYHIVTIQGNGLRKCSIDNTEVMNQSGYALVKTSDIKCLCFGFNKQGTPSNFYRGKVYSIKVSQDNLLLANYIPCYNKSSGEIGMYDTVSKQFYTNSGTGTFLKGNDVTYDNVNLLESRRRILLNTPHIETISDTVAGFKTDVATKLKECKIHFTPIQEGEGDPSPENVRPITGWDGVTVTKCGKNLIPEYNDTNFWSIAGWFDGSGIIHNNSSYKMCDYKNVSPGKTYTLSTSATTWKGIGFYDELYNPLKFNQQAAVSIKLTCPNNAKYYRVYSMIGAKQHQFEEGSEPTDYEPYNATSITIPFPQTIYGGYVDLVKGEVVEEYNSFILDGENYKFTGASSDGVNAHDMAMHYNYIGYSGLSNLPKSIATANTIYSSLLPINVTANIQGVDYNCIQTYSGTGNRYLRAIISKNELADISTGSAITTSINEWFSNNPTQIVYKLAAPINYSIDPQILKALRGMNNIWSDANGNVEVSFYTH